MADKLKAKIINLEYTRGDSFAITFLIKDAKGKELDISAYTSASLAVTSDEDPVNTDNQQFLLTGVIASPRVSFAPSTIESDIAPAVYYYDAQLIDASGGKRTFVRGKFTLVQDRTKA